MWLRSWEEWGEVSFAAENVLHRASIAINKPDFSTTFDQHKVIWTTTWKWTGGRMPAPLENKIAEYLVQEHIRSGYENELQLWIMNSWLVPYPEEELGPPQVLIPLMVIVQDNKGKVRLVMDYRELNNFVDAYMANVDVCALKLWEWWQQGSNVATLDLRRAYLQVRVPQSLWPFQIKERRYCLTQLGFGLNVAPKIMSVIMNVVMSQDEEIQRATSSYIDNVYVNDNVASSRRVKEHLECFGLVCKAPEPVQEWGECTWTTCQWWWRKTSPETRQWCHGSPISDHLSEHLLHVWETARPFSHMWLIQSDSSSCKA